jgi:hypothetical protein
LLVELGQSQKKKNPISSFYSAKKEFRKGKRRYQKTIIANIPLFLSSNLAKVIDKGTKSTTPSLKVIFTTCPFCSPWYRTMASDSSNLGS